MRGWPEIRDHFHRLGIKLHSVKQDGSSDPIAKARYKEVSDWLRGASALKRHRKWWQVYKIHYCAAYDAERREGFTKEQSHKRARPQAEMAVVKAFHDEVTTTRAVRNALDYLRDDLLADPALK
jgi:hypothetical protein